MNSSERLEILKDMLQIDSANKNEEDVAKCIAKHLSASGITSKLVEYSPGRSNLVAEIGSGETVLALSGHMDVVPTGNPVLWDTPPFTPTEKDGKIFARGATDMKSGLAAMVAAIKELAEEKVELGGKLRLLATVGEEVGLLGAEQLTKEGYANDVEALIIGEPTGHRIAYAHKGIFTYVVTSYGKSAHSSMPEQGVNAIDNLLVFYNKMMEEFGKLTQENVALGKLIYCNSILNGGQQFNMVPDKASLSANLRTIPEVNNEMVTTILKDIVSSLNKNIPDMKLELEIVSNDPPMFSDINSKLVKVALSSSEKMFGKVLPVLGAPGGTDAAKFIQANKDMQIIIFGPGNDTLHQINENVGIDNYLEMIDLYKNIVLDYFKTP